MKQVLVIVKNSLKKEEGADGSIHRSPPKAYLLTIGDDRQGATRDRNRVGNFQRAGVSRRPLANKIVRHGGMSPAH
ncbi:MAG: hypothetical protein IPL87_05060 [Candidatus Moraniibacteriota bacterium]|nr:MAG: hypothetical protein IPL87_05060 [Candidatus Moranbacteria bacterium]